MNKAMIFAAGIGSRLKPFTDHHPKALAPVGGIAMLQRVIEKLRDEAGIGEMVVNVHHFSGQIVEFLSKNNNFGVDISISDESGRLLDTGGGLLRARKLLNLSPGDALVLHNADILTDFSLASMIEAHRRSGADATLMVSERLSSRVLLFDADGMLRGWRNLTTGETIPPNLVPTSTAYRSLAFGGVHVVSPTVFAPLQKYSAGCSNGVFSITPFYLSQIGHLNIKAYTPDTPFSWFDIGTPEKLARAVASLT